MEKERTSKIWMIIPSGIVILYVWWTASAIIEAMVVYGLYTLSFIGVIYGILHVAIKIRKMATEWEIEKANARKAKAEAQSAEARAANDSVLVVTAPKDNQLIVRDPSHESKFTQLHLMPQRQVNGFNSDPTQEELSVYKMFHSPKFTATPAEGVIEGETVEVESFVIPSGEDWIESHVLTAHHLHLCGSTGSGKTTLANQYIRNRMKQDPRAEFYLLNPKHIASEEAFIVDPVCESPETALETLMSFNDIMLNRKNDKSFVFEQSSPIIFIIDEWDWLHSIFKDKATRLAVNLIKVGRALNISVVLVGQSPLTGDTGLSGSDFDNMTRVGIWKAGEKLIDALRLEKGIAKTLRSEMQSFQDMNDGLDLRRSPKVTRYCLISSPGKNPRIGIIPKLGYITAKVPKLALPEGKPNRVKALPKPVAKAKPETVPNDDEMVIFRAWAKLAPGTESYNAIWTKGLGYKSPISQRKSREFQALFSKYNVALKKPIKKS